MEEISVVVQQEVGSISWNFEEIKKNLSEQLDVFKKTIYTDDTIKSAKTDIASLRKLSKDIESRRKEVKAKCMEPYNMIEAQAKELVALIDEPIRAINEQVEDYERRRREAIKAKIEEFWNINVEKLPEDMRQKAHDKLYDSRWENASCTMKQWKDAIQKGLQDVYTDLQTIEDCGGDFKEDMLQEYSKNLELREAIAKMNQLKAMQERALEIERKKKEEAERKAAEEATRLAAQDDTHETAQEPETEHEKNETVKISPEENKTKQEPNSKPDDGLENIVLKITGTAEQIDLIKKFIAYKGAKWQEV